MAARHLNFRCGYSWRDMQSPLRKLLNGQNNRISRNRMKVNLLKAFRRTTPLHHVLPLPLYRYIWEQTTIRFVTTLYVTWSFSDLKKVSHNTSSENWERIHVQYYCYWYTHFLLSKWQTYTQHQFGSGFSMFLFLLQWHWVSLFQSGTYSTRISN